MPLVNGRRILGVVGVATTITVTLAGCSVPSASTLPPPPTTSTTTSSPTTTTIICVENPQAQQWAQQARSDDQAAQFIDQQLVRDDPGTKPYNADYERLQNAELATSNDLDQLHAADNCYLYQSLAHSLTAN